MQFEPILRGGLGALLAFAVVEPMFAESAAAQQLQASTSSAYRELIAALRPRQMIEESNARVVDSVIAAMFKSDPDMMRIRTEQPEVAKAITDAITPIMLRYMVEADVGMTSDLETLFAAKLSPQEAKEMAVFWRSSQGYGILRDASQNYIAGGMIAAVMAGKELTPEILAADREIAERNTLANLKNDEALGAVLAFSTPAGIKFAAIAPEIKAITAKWDDADLTPEEEKEIEEAVISAFGANAEAE